MKKNNYYLGIDTSAYTTSVAVLDDKLDIVCDIRKVLNVKKGNKGLRQQEAIFQHLQNIPILIDELSKNIDIDEINAIAVSDKPRDVEGSYMPVFSVGENVGFIMSKSIKARYFKFSHQEGHIGSGILGTDFPEIKNFIAIHISGGTSELCIVNKNNNKFYPEIVGGSKDISIGQFIDRLGVMLGLSFPAGYELDILSREGKLIDKRIPINKNDNWFNLSGLETFFKKIIDEDCYPKADISKSIFYSVGLILKNAISAMIKETNIKDILIVGGVASNEYIKNFLIKELNKYNCKLYFPMPAFCTDNALGLAYLAKLNCM